MSYIELRKYHNELIERLRDFVHKLEDVPYSDEAVEDLKALSNELDKAFFVLDEQRTDAASK